MRKAPQLTLADYEPIVGRGVIEELELLGSKLAGKVIQNVNSTFTGGGVAEILSRMVPLMGQLGVDARWSVITGNGAFFNVTKKMHNALHGREDVVGPEDQALFMEVSNHHLEEIKVQGDIMFIHDPQPVALVRRKRESNARWVWRCHIDVSSPNPQVWKFILPFIGQYDGAVFSAPQFSPVLPIRQFLISPSIDPLSDKNRELPKEVIDKVLDEWKVPRDKPIITQVSRFDYLKDP